MHRASLERTASEPLRRADGRRAAARVSLADAADSRGTPSAAGCDLRSDAPAHRFAAYGQRGGFPLAYSLDHSAEAGFEPGIRIGDATAVLCVKKIERDDVDPTRRQRCRELYDEATGLTGTCSMSEDQTDRRPV